MTGEELRKLRAHYLALKGLQRVLERDATASVVRKSTVETVRGTFDRLEGDFTGLVPRFDLQAAFRHDQYYDMEPIRAYVATAIGILEAQLDDEASPVVEARAFGFISDPSLRKIVERDYVEIQRAFVSQCWKSVIILSGGAIEAILTDLLSSR